MKSKEEIEQLAKKQKGCSKEYCDSIDEQYGYLNGYIDGYTKCQEDNKNKKYTEEDLFNAFNAGIDCEFGGAPSYDVWIKEYIKKYENANTRTNRKIQ
jgi:hypothetical protein